MHRLLLAALTWAGCFSTVRSAAAPLELPASGFPHAQLTGILSAYVDDAGRVDYRGLAASRGELDAYVATLALTSPVTEPGRFSTRAAAMTYYINAYNAFAITGVLDRPGLGGVDDNLASFFYTTRYVAGGEAISLYHIENEVIRPTFGDPRIHFALNCQSAGCPRLPREAFLPETLEGQLDRYTREFVTHPDKVRLRGDGVAEISQIFEWYAEDFEAAGGPVAFINRRGGQLPADAPVEFIPYDWTLIAQPGRGP